jgi:peptidyl-prolyl cis-trans isomerase A (cyclophilin A)
MIALKSRFSVTHPTLTALFALLIVIILPQPVFANTEAPAAAPPPQVILHTNHGDIVIELHAKESPLSVQNFLKYASNGFYNNTIFHRVIENFMIQGGGFTEKMVKKQTHSPIKNEAKNGLKNIRGSVAMARTGQVDSATSQFFINLVDNRFLDHGVRDYGYAVFGQVVKGMDVVDKIGNAKTRVKNGMRDVPTTAIIIEKVTQISNNHETPTEKSPK